MAQIILLCILTIVVSVIGMAAAYATGEVWAVVTCGSSLSVALWGLAVVGGLLP